MNLVFDFGNTRIKAAIFNSSNTIENVFYFATQTEIYEFITNLKNIKACIIGSVTELHGDLAKRLTMIPKVHLFKNESIIPLINLYKSKNSLGSDRLAAAVGGYSFYKNQPVLTIDAGTCIKYNFTNEKNEFLGGAISPGIIMRYKALNEFTYALPLLQLNENYEKLTGNSTSESLNSGVQLGATFEVQQAIEAYLQLYPNLKVILTGGDANYLSKQLKNRFFAEPNLVLIGLNTILNCN